VVAEPKVDRASIDITCDDGRRLKGVFVEARVPVGAALIAPATGVPAGFYYPFQRALGREGFSSLVFDYRGVGGGIETLRKDPTRKQDWGERDMPAALEALRERCPDLPMTLVGHSAGGQLVGLMPNVSRFERIIQVSASSGSIWGMRLGYAIYCALLLACYIPVCCALLGYAATKKIGWGVDLPSGVARQWARWCLGRGYLERDFGRTIERHWFASIRCPVLNITMGDDPLATADNVRDLLRLFTKADVEVRRLDPAAFGLARVGHAGFFRRANRILWPQVFESMARRQPDIIGAPRRSEGSGAVLATPQSASEGA